MKSIWYTFRFKVPAIDGTLKINDAFAKLVDSGAIQGLEFVRATPAKDEKGSKS